MARVAQQWVFSGTPRTKSNTNQKFKTKLKKLLAYCVTYDVCCEAIN